MKKNKEVKLPGGFIEITEEGMVYLTHTISENIKQFVARIPTSVVSNELLMIHLSKMIVEKNKKIKELQSKIRAERD